jgi:hypothetical protein
MRPSALDHTQLIQGVSTVAHGFRRDKENEKVGPLNFLRDPVVVFLTGNEIFAVEEYVMLLGDEREMNPIGQVPVIRTVAQKDVHG